MHSAHMMNLVNILYMYMCGIFHLLVFSFRLDGTLNGLCDDVTNSCTDVNTKCDSSSDRCVCETDYSEFENVCYKGLFQC